MLFLGVNCQSLWQVISLVKNGVIPLIQIGIPIILIILGMLDLGKAVVASKEDEMKKAQSTFIKRVVETLIVPNIEDEYERKRALDEIPQSAAGKTIMTTEPKFVPNEAVEITVGDNLKLKK